MLVLPSAMASNRRLILGGSEVPLGDHLYVSGIREGRDRPSECGGVLISPSTVLTAAHCIVDYNITHVAVGTHFRVGSSDGEVLRVTKAFSHPLYNEDPVAYDYGVLELEKPSTIDPVEISWDDVQDGTMGTVRGWGTTSYGGDPSQVLKEVSVKIWRNEECNKVLWLRGYGVTETMLCAGGVEGENTCTMDNGGPLTTIINGKEFLVGLVKRSSWVGGCGEKGEPSLYVRLANAKEWLNQWVKPAC